MYKCNKWGTFYYVIVLKHAARPDDNPLLAKLDTDT